MQFHKGKLITYFSILFSIIFVWFLFLQLLPEKDTIWNYAFNIAYAFLFFSGALLSFYYAVRSTMNIDIRIVLWLFGAGLLSYAAGLCMWAYYNIVVQLEIPYPSLADFFFIAYLIFTMIGFLYLIKKSKKSLSARIIFDSLIFVIISAIIIYQFYSHIELSSDLSLLTNILNVTYPLLDIVLLSIVLITLRIFGGEIQQNILLLTIGFMVDVIADLLFTYRTTQDSYWNGDISDFMFATAAYMISIGLVYTIAAFRNSEKV